MEVHKWGNIVVSVHKLGGPVRYDHGMIVWLRRKDRVFGLVLVSLLAGEVLAGKATDPNEVLFGRDVRPILSDRCFLCHGPDRANQQAGLRLDSREASTAPRERGAAIVPGDPDASLLISRISSRDPAYQMPPPESGKHGLTDAQIQILRQWIEQGAVYEPHWAFSPPIQVEPPPIENAQWCRNTIDRFILARLDALDLKPNPQAERATLCRRLYLDLTGLPPTPEEVEAFEQDESPEAYENLVDRLLSQEPYQSRYAERMATPWMDQARYADTSGIHMDAGRSIWAWRDWVLSAYRDNLPFDQFVLEQLAGDLIPGATEDQQIASGFNRNHVTSDEGGAINEEYLFEYAIDRTNTTGEVFLGLTVGCAQCHDHKFDPVTSEDYYGLIAFFNNNEEPGIYSQVPDPYRALEPALTINSDESSQSLAAIDASLAQLKLEQELPMADEADRIAAYIKDFETQGKWNWQRPGVVSAFSNSGTTLTPQSDGSVLSSGENPAQDRQEFILQTQATGLRTLVLEAMKDATLPLGRVGRAANGNVVLTGLSVEVISLVDPTKRQPLKFSWAWTDISQANGDFPVSNVLRPDDGRGWAVAAHQIEGGRQALLLSEKPFGYEGGSLIVVRLNYDSIYDQHAFGRIRIWVGHVQEALLSKLPAAQSNWYIVGPYPTENGDSSYETAFGPEEAGPLNFQKKYNNQSWRYAPGVIEDSLVTLAQGIGAEYIGREIYAPSARQLDVSLGSDDGLQVYLNGQLVHENRVDRGVSPNQDQVSLNLKAGLNTLVLKVTNTGGPRAMYYRAIEREAEIPADLVALALPRELQSDDVQEKISRSWRLKYSPQYRSLSKQIMALESDKEAILSGVPKTMVMKERASPRDTYVMKRGRYDAPDENRKVSRTVPAFLGSLETEEMPTRIDLAQWLMSEQNPLTARVTVNRLWEMLFGMGLVETTNDFGMQGAWPSHPELLDYLAVEFRDQQWDVKALLRLIVTSATYRQSSAGNDQSRLIDPDNRFLSWYPRQRLSAEQIRDQALHISGLLVEEFGGPSVKPYQPEGLWQEVAMPQSNTRTFVQDTGDALWRRSLYTYWKRASPPPSMLTLDAPTREYCVTRRLTTNTPLQALVLWNDVQFVEAARAIAARVLLSGENDQQRLQLLYRYTTSGQLNTELQASLREALEAYRVRFTAAPDDAVSLVTLGESEIPDGISVADLASWTMIANALLSSDAAIVKD